MARQNDRQRKAERKAKKTSKRRDRDRLRKSTDRPLPLAAAQGLDEAEDLMNAGDDGKAILVLEELRRRYPRRSEILVTLADAYRRVGDSWAYQATCERLALASPLEPINWLALGSAALVNAQPAAAHRALAHMAASWPNHVETSHALELLGDLDDFLAAECQRRNLDANLGFRILQLHDEINLHLNRGKFDQVCDAAQRLLALCPHFAPALNNRSEAHFRSGRYEQAMADCRRVLEFDADNYHALANLARYQYLAGRSDEAIATSARLKLCRSDNDDLFVKTSETLAFLADWEGVLHAYRASMAGTQVAPPLLEHLAGVAQANLGDFKAARKHWERAAKSSESFEWARENSRDSKRPPGKRHGPWAFPLESWIPRAVIEELADSAEKMSQNDRASQVVSKFFATHSFLETLTPEMLQRSDGAACEFLIRLAPLVERPAIFGAIKDFAFSERGSDSVRMDAMFMLSQAGIVEPGVCDLWSEGARKPIAFMAQEITCEPTVELPPEVNDLALRAHQSLNDGQGAAAERYLNEALRLRPDDVSMQFNRALAIGLQGREEESLAIIRSLHQQHPDYVFARTRLAQECIEKGDFSGAQLLLDPIRQRRRLHQSEHAAWCSANIELMLAEGNLDGAKRWLKMWEGVAPDDPRIKIFKRRLNAERGLSKYLPKWIQREAHAE